MNCDSVPSFTACLSADMTSADKSPNCLGVVSNATLNVVAHKDGTGANINAGGFLDLAYTYEQAGVSDPSNMRFVIAGRHGKVRADGEVRIRNASAKIVFQIPAEGFAETPLVVRNFAEVAQGASIVVEAAEDWPYGAKQTLVELVNGQTFHWSGGDGRAGGGTWRLAARVRGRYEGRGRRTSVEGLDAGRAPGAFHLHGTGGVHVPHLSRRHDDAG